MGVAGGGFNSSPGRIHAGGSRRRFFARPTGRGKTGRTNDCRSFYAAAGCCKKSRVHGGGRIQEVGGTEGKNIRVERQFDRGKSTTGHGGSALAVAARRRPSRRRFGNTSVLAPERGRAITTERGATGKPETDSAAATDASANAGHGLGAVCDVNLDTNSDGSAICCSDARTAALRLPRPKTANAIVGIDHQSWCIRGERHRHAAGSISKSALRRGRIALVLLCFPATRFGHHRHLASGLF